MPSKKQTEQALTLSAFKANLASELSEFYGKIIGPGVQKIISEEIQSFRHEAHEKFLTLSQLSGFFKSRIEPRFQLLEQEIQVIRRDQKEVQSEVSLLRNDIYQLHSESLGRFDDLYKKFEDLRQEYVIVKEQLKRFDDHDYEMMKNVSEIKNKVIDLEKEVEALERKLQLN